MRQIDFAPLYRSTVGFDRLFDMLDGVSGFDAGPTAYPPYNIERLGDNEYRITMAVAGFSEDELKVDVKEQTLSVRGEKKAEQTERQFLHRGIATRSFVARSFVGWVKRSPTPVEIVTCVGSSLALDPTYT